MNCVCHRCGGQKASAFLPCPVCEYTPRPMDRPMAWLFSKAHLSHEELVEASQRIRKGEQPEPSEALLKMARNAIKKQALVQSTDHPVSPVALAGIASISVILTPLAGFAFWWGYRQERPTAATQILKMTWPISIGFLILWVGLITTRLFG